MAKQSYQVFDITLSRRTQLTPSLARFTFTGADVARMATHAPDQRIKLFFPTARGSLEALFDCVAAVPDDWYAAYRGLPEALRPPMRTYTIRALRAGHGEVDIEFVLHGDEGPASRWAMRAQPGDRLAMTAPTADVENLGVGYEWKPPRGVQRILVVADETALPAAAGILETLAARADRPQVDALIEVPLRDDTRPLAMTAGVRWLPRDVTPGCAHGERLLRAVRDVDLRAEIARLADTTDNIEGQDEPAEDELLWEAAATDDGAPFYAWIAAESKVALGIRRYLVNECGLPRRYVSSMGYWREGKVLG
ncbi:siderophore-interacting protein [Halomonas sp. MCCC 1A17488]|uniref:siderophore-interacting protein n=1 Tax=unclassified Halomonas TaxID=2609666 RepID=UPI0018D24027|nr:MULTISPECIES: siderophore-interacting protein [unclassified Halomonas]MCE8017690.1 siderophore-interacting protein [Halomonas sp. MCCC 1A17488]MCG3241023.1 siderophore-interacting protein [Halomonas sp. MCCC 1A17488]QPP48889.1 siderophore-interacting protein [Halomonas sp. SS10-MC5]